MSAALALSPSGMGALMLRQQHLAQHPHRDFSKSSHHSVTPSLHQDNCAEVIRMSSGSSGRISGIPSRDVVRSKLATALSTAAPTAKHIAREAQASVDAAEGWRGGTNIPGGYNLILLARQFPQVKAAVRELMDMDAELDPETARVMMDLHQRLAAMRKVGK